MKKKIFDGEFCISLFENLPDSILMLSGEKIINCNDSAANIFGYETREELIGLGIFQISPRKQPTGEDSIELGNSYIDLALIKGSHTFEWLYLRKDGSEIYTEVVLVRLLTKKKKIMGAIIRDITERKKEEKKVRQYIITDKLTGLYNRSFFIDRLNIEIQNKQGFAVMLVDIDGFKAINDNLGHACGDKVLEIVANRISKCVRSNDVVARMGDDEFIILLAGIKKHCDIVDIAENIIDSIKYPVKIDESELYISVSIGIVVYPTNGEDSATLITNADIAMYKAKEFRSSSFEFYKPSLNGKVKEEFMIRNGLRYALKRNEFTLHYQPIINLKTHRIIGAEALIRWKHPKNSRISPAKFIPVAEKNGLISSIGEWVLMTACLENKKWQDLGYPPIFIAVNISAKQLDQDGFVDSIVRILRETRLEPKYLELEITESISVENFTNRVETLYKIKELGVRLAIDDFGTGYSSLGQLKKLPISKLKIDRSFINDINLDYNNTLIVSTIIAIAKTLNIHVVAEGVETEEQLYFLSKESCDMVQGYFYSPPVSADIFEKMFTNYKKQSNLVIDVSDFDFQHL